MVFIHSLASDLLNHWPAMLSSDVSSQCVSEAENVRPFVDIAKRSNGPDMLCILIVYWSQEQPGSLDDSVVLEVFINHCSDVELPM